MNAELEGIDPSRYYPIGWLAERLVSNRRDGSGLDPSTVRYGLRRAGVALRRTGKAPGQGRLDLPVAEIIRRYWAGQSTHAIGRALGVSADTIHRRLVEAGVARRPPGTRGVKAAGQRPKPAGRKGT
jgi:hypothetical protein